MDEEASFFMAKELEEGYLIKHPGIYSFDTVFDPSDIELERFETLFPYKEKRESRVGDL